MRKGLDGGRLDYDTNLTLRAAPQPRSPDNRMFALSRSMESPVRISGALSSALSQWGGLGGGREDRGRTSPPPFMLSTKDDGEDSPKRSGLR